MPDAPPPLDLDAIRVRADARRDYADERPESLHVPEDYAALADESAADVPALVEEVKRLRADAARPAPAWDEEVVRGAFIDARLASALEVMADGYPSVCIRSNEEAADVALAVVRDHLPVKPSREEVARALAEHRLMGGRCRCGLDPRLDYYRYEQHVTDAVLDLWPERSEVEVKAEMTHPDRPAPAWDEDAKREGAIKALRDAAEEMTELGMEEYTARAVSDWLSGHADHLAAEGGADRGSSNPRYT